MTFRLAVLWRHERMQCSSLGTLNRFVQIARRVGVQAEILEAIDEGRPPEYDGLFLRTRPLMGNHAHRAAELFYGLCRPVIDKPVDILLDLDKCAQEKLWQKAGIRRPATIIAALEETDARAIIAQLGLPVVVKTPDGSFCDGVELARNEFELAQLLSIWGGRWAQLICQEFIDSPYDWRIGVLDGEPLFACRYYPAPGDWRIIKPSIASRPVEGRHQTISLADVPLEVTQMALEAACVSGVSLAGVDIKRDQAPVLIEINCNPTIEQGIEDAKEGDAVWERIARWFLYRPPRVGSNLKRAKLFGSPK